MALPTDFNPLPKHRAISIVRGETEAHGVQECLDAWRTVHEFGWHDQLLDWQLGVMQNLVFGQVIDSERLLVPGLPTTYSPYGALRK